MHPYRTNSVIDEPKSKSWGATWWARFKVKYWYGKRRCDDCETLKPRKVIRYVSSEYIGGQGYFCTEDTFCDNSYTKQFLIYNKKPHPTDDQS